MSSLRFCTGTILAVISLTACQHPATHADAPGNARPTPPPTTSTPAPKPKVANAGIAKKLVVSGAITRVTGHFGTYEPPFPEDTFEIDLGNLPKRFIQFEHPPLKRDGSPNFPNSPYQPCLFSPGYSSQFAIEQVVLPKDGIEVGRIRVSAGEGARKLVIQIEAKTLETGSPAKIVFYEEETGKGRNAQAEAEGVLR